MTLKSLTRMFRRKPEPTLPQIFLPVPFDNSKVSIENREKLRDWLIDPTTRLAFSIVETSHPSAFLGLRIGVAPEINSQIGLQRLHQIQGFETCRNAFLLLAHTPQEVEALREKFMSVDSTL